MTKSGDPPTGTAMNATDAQNNFGSVLDRAAKEGVVFITRYDRPAAVLMSIERYDAMVASDTSSLGELARDFDELVGRMQTDEARAGVDVLFGSSGEDLADAAVREAERDESE